MEKQKKLPLIYSCSGCSSAAQLANDIALKLDREGTCEMSCIAGIGGQVKPLLHKSKSSTHRILLDGCPLQCSRHCFENASIDYEAHIDLSKLDVRKKLHEEYSTEEWDSALAAVQALITNE